MYGKLKLDQNVFVTVHILVIRDELSLVYKIIQEPLF